MVDVGEKTPSRREAAARVTVRLGEAAFRAVESNAIAKGDVLNVARIAGIQGAKSTASLIPLCHPLSLNYVDIGTELVASEHAVVLTATVRCSGQTGVEMEALTAASVAALTVYDMCKAVTKDIVIDNLCLVHKSGGKSGDYVRDGEQS